MRLTEIYEYLKSNNPKVYVIDIAQKEDLQSKEPIILITPLTINPSKNKDKAITDYKTISIDLIGSDYLTIQEKFQAIRSIENNFDWLHFDSAEYFKQTDTETNRFTIYFNYYENE